MKHAQLTRRKFLQNAALVGGACAMGWPARLSWAVEPSPGTRTLKLLYYTDIHARVEWDTPVAMMKAAEAINAHTADLVICGGDLITDGYTSGSATTGPRWDAYLAMHNAINPKPEAALGNHDLVGAAPEDGTAPQADPRIEFREKLGLEKTYRSFDRHGYHFIFLDSIQVTSDDLRYRGYVDSDQREWIKADLAALAPGTPIIVVSHMPMLTGFFQMTEGVESPVPPNRGLVNNKEVLGLFEKHNLLLVLQGHLHVNEMIRWGNTTFITGGAICGKWWRGEWQGTDAGFGVVTLNPGRVDWAYHTYGWTPRRPQNA